MSQDFELLKDHLHAIESIEFGISATSTLLFPKHEKFLLYCLENQIHNLSSISIRTALLKARIKISSSLAFDSTK